MTAGRKLIQRANNKSRSSKTKTMTLQYKVKHGRETACSNIHHIHFVYGIYIFSRCVHVLCFIQGKKSHGIFLRFWQKTHSAYDNNHTSCVRHKSNTKNHSRARLLRKCRRKKNVLGVWRRAPYDIGIDGWSLFVESRERTMGFWLRLRFCVSD